MTLQWISFLRLGESEASVLLTTDSYLKSTILGILTWRSAHQNTLLFLKVFFLHLQSCLLSGNLCLSDKEVTNISTISIRLILPPTNNLSRLNPGLELSKQLLSIINKEFSVIVDYRVKLETKKYMFS